MLCFYCINDSFTSEYFRVILEDDMSDDMLDGFDLFVFHGLYFYKYIGLAKKILSKGKRYFVKPHSSLVIDAQKKSLSEEGVSKHFIFKKFVKHADAVIFTNEDEARNSIQWNLNIIYEGNGIASIQTDNTKKRVK